MANARESISYYRHEFRFWNRARLVAQWASIALIVLYYDPRLSDGAHWFAGLLLTATTMAWIASAASALGALGHLDRITDELARGQ